MKLPTEPAQAVLLAIHDHIAATGESPLLKQLVTEDRPLTAAQWHVGGLRKLGLVTRTRRHSSIALTPEGHRVVAMLKGWSRVSAGGENAEGTR